VDVASYKVLYWCNALKYRTTTVASAAPISLHGLNWCFVMAPKSSMLQKTLLLLLSVAVAVDSYSNLPQQVSYSCANNLRLMQPSISRL